MGWWTRQVGSQGSHPRPCLAYLVDPVTREIRVVEFDGQSDTALRLLVGSPAGEGCEVCRDGGEWGELLFVDDHRPHPEGGWRLDDGRTIVGPAILYGRASDGAPDNPPIPLPKLTRLIRWVAGDGSSSAMATC